MNNTFIGTLAGSLPENPGIHGRNEYLESAVLVPLLVVDNEYHLLFQKRANGISQGNEICFPGGHHDVRLDSSFLDTALRETTEELGIPREKITTVGKLDVVVAPRGVIVEPFVGLLCIDSLDELVPDRAEVEEVFTLPLSWFLKNSPEIYHSRIEIQSSYVDEDDVEHILLPVEKLGLPSQYKGNRPGWKYKVVVYKTGKHIIWGLTASILFGFINRVKDLVELAGEVHR